MFCLEVLAIGYPRCFNGRIPWVRKVFIICLIVDDVKEGTDVSGLDAFFLDSL